MADNNEIITASRVAVSSVKLAEPISLIGKLAKKLTNITKQMSPEDDAAKSVMLVLQCLINKNGITQLEIVKFTGFKAPTVSIMLQKMEREGYVKRKPDTYDLRAIRVYITQKGVDSYLSAVNTVKKIEDAVLSGLTSEETDALVSALKKIENNIDSME